MIVSLNVKQNLISAERYIKKQLNEKFFTENDLIVFQELPYRHGGKKTKRREKFEGFLEKNALELLESPFIPDGTDFQTAVVCKKGAYVRVKSYEDCLTVCFEEYCGRVIAVEKANAPDIRIIGVHMPTNGHSDYAATSCWDSLISLYKRFPKELPVICVGDFNTYEAGRINKRRMYEFMSYGLVDFWLEKGHSHNRATFNSGARIDYALVTDKDYSALAEKYDMEVDDSTREGDKPLSDHSAIILREKTKT